MMLHNTAVTVCYPTDVFMLQIVLQKCHTEAQLISTFSICLVLVLQFYLSTGKRSSKRPQSQPWARKGHKEKVCYF